MFKPEDVTNNSTFKMKKQQKYMFQKEKSTVVWSWYDLGVDYFTNSILI